MNPSIPFIVLLCLNNTYCKQLRPWCCIYFTCFQALLWFSDVCSLLRLLIRYVFFSCVGLNYQLLSICCSLCVISDFIALCVYVFALSTVKLGKVMVYENSSNTTNNNLIVFVRILTLQWKCLRFIRYMQKWSNKKWKKKHPLYRSTWKSGNAIHCLLVIRDFC